VKKIAIMMIAIMLTVLASVALAGDKGEGMVGRLFLFQKCDPSLAPGPEEQNPLYDSNGCPVPESGLWAIFLDNRRWGQMKYNLLGDKFRFSFQGKRLVPETDYTLIYYPDEWPGSGLICLGSSMTNHTGNVQIHGSAEIPSGLPAPYDKNYSPIAPSGAVGAKIWLVPTADVKCDSSGDIDPTTGLPADPAQMVGWNPANYLFEGNLIVYQYSAPVPEEMDADIMESEEMDFEESSAPVAGNASSDKKGKDKQK
jgi:hypothetical protein